MRTLKAKKRPKGYWTKERCHERALKYTNRTEFARGPDSAAYDYAKRQGWTDDICGHMKMKRVPIGHWDIKENVLEVARSCSTVAEFFTAKGGGPYNAAVRNGWRDECWEGLTRKQVPAGYWTETRIRDAAGQCDNPTEFKKRFPGAAKIAMTEGYWEELTLDMPERKKAIKFWWTYERCAEEVKLYPTRQAMQEGSPSAFNAITNNGWIELFTEMDYRPHAEPLHAYYIRIDHLEQGPIYKLGITRYEDVLQRFQHTEDRQMMTVIKTWSFASSALCRSFEDTLLKTYEHASYEGPDILKSGGNTELFVRDILGLDRGAA